jgi:hypothetical protein
MMLSCYSASQTPFGRRGVEKTKLPRFTRRCLRDHVMATFSCPCRIHKLFNNSLRNFLWGPASFFNSMGCGENIQCTQPRRKDDPKETHLFISRKLQKQPTGRDFCPLRLNSLVPTMLLLLFFYYSHASWLILYILKLTII